MNRLIKALPLMAVILGLTVFLGNAASKAIAKNTATDQEWMFNGGDRANPEDYIPAPGSSENCQGDLEVCIVSAPADSEDSNKPDFSQVLDLEEALENNTTHDNITRGTYVDPQ
jgi:hypothetical protein